MRRGPSRAQDAMVRVGPVRSGRAGLDARGVMRPGVRRPVAGPPPYLLTARIASTSSWSPTTASNELAIFPSAPTTKSHGSVGIP
jgi:hypothetical protein